MDTHPNIPSDSRSLDLGSIHGKEAALTIFPLFPPYSLFCSRIQLFGIIEGVPSPLNVPPLNAIPRPLVPLVIHRYSPSTNPRFAISLSFAAYRIVDFQIENAVADF